VGKWGRGGDGSFWLGVAWSGAGANAKGHGARAPGVGKRRERRGPGGPHVP
jgi:hypothetical protein